MSKRKFKLIRETNMKLKNIFNKIEGINESILDPPQKEKIPLWLVDKDDHFNPEVK